MLGVAPITLKRICQRRNYRWPYRSIKAAEKRRERQRAAAIAAAIAGASSGVSSAAAAPGTSYSTAPTPSSSPSPQHKPPSPSPTHYNHLGLLARQFPHASASSPMELTKWLPRATFPTDPRSSPPSTAFSTPARRPMSPRRDKTVTSPLSELSLGCSSMLLTSTLLPPLRVALHPNYLAVRQHEQRVSTEFRFHYACNGRGGGVSRPSTA